MHILIGLITILGAAALWYWRLRMAREAGGEILDAASDLKAAARRLKYKRRHDQHPADSIEDPRLAAAGIAVAVATMDAPLTKAEIVALTKGAEDMFGASRAEADDIVAFGRWIAAQCGTSSEAVRRLTKTVDRTAGPEAGPDLIALVERAARADGGMLGESEQDAVDAIRRGLGLARPTG